MPICYSNIDYMMYKHSETEISILSSSWSPDMYIAEDFKIFKNWEIMTDDPLSNYVVVKTSI